MSQTLAEVFDAVAHKQLVLVDLPGGSNQHELNGKKVFQEFFKTSDRVEGDFTWHYFSDDHDVVTEDSSFTWYDSRLKGAPKTGRSEWRFYYHDNFLAIAEAGDELFLVRTTIGRVHALVFKEGSAKLRSARLLFGITTTSDQFQLVPDSTISRQELELVRSQIIEELDLDIHLPISGNDEEIIVCQFGEQFPKTRLMSSFARAQVQTDVSDPDTALVAWLNREEQLFRALEKVIVGKRIKEGFNSVDDLMEYSKSAHQRRKSRMGFALENHLSELFIRDGLRFAAQCRTEGRSKPDFIFPGSSEYKDPTFDPDLLTMLGAKASAKERWKQVLAEADRISRKHVCTIEPGISENQTEEMTGRKVTLVVPTSLHATYSDRQQAVMLDLKGFIELVRGRQGKG